ncbi:protein-L-isoaspartate(D-aspartate) O-methyltransferase [Methanocalculus taiwanensis]|uniref:Protein-L-isoaspartate O-methyltransferase n=1 Tax=Methanocalculus taiwanensis TaxID=106207 RepID=A0ABD4TPG3_9EURY|nr:protein-L-isoaspartate(D-aspartate) O-methyltransferase [Methanocalculus taiwanensis]MCQ1539165.1 protein-L-isoaspartate(D-aspartate) O-methyltransferase [Methanocalculus taiwanensis]
MNDLFVHLRRSMVNDQIRSRGITDERVLLAMEEVERHLFVPHDLEREAYHDSPLPIGHGQTISQPYIVAEMTALLRLRPGDSVLEVGTGSGYQAALLAIISGRVISIERIPEVARRAEENLRRAGVEGVRIFVSDGTAGYPEAAPYDAILVTAAAPSVPTPLFSQLADGGRLVAPVGDRNIQHLVRITRQGDEFLQECFEPVRFVPLIGEYGWQE